MNARLLLAVVGTFVLAGCAATHEQVFDAASAVQLRSYQTRVFDTPDRRRTLRTVIAALQDLGFVIDEADAVVGTVSATRLDRIELRVTVTVRPRGDTQTVVRANASHGAAAVEEPGPYRDFFAALEKAMFLEARQLD